MKLKLPNIWTARCVHNGEIYYFPALFDGERYTLPFNKREQNRFYDRIQWSGTLSDMKGYRKYHTAKKRAWNQFGYSMVAQAKSQFGPDFQDIEGIWPLYEVHFSEDIQF